MWFILALASSIFAALTSILAKIGIDGVNSNLATAIRTVVVLVMSWGMVFLTNAQVGITEISRRSWVFLVLTQGTVLCVCGIGSHKFNDYYHKSNDCPISLAITP